MGRMAGTSAVWRVVNEWLALVPFPPSQSRIAEHVGVSRSAVSDWKSGKSRPDPDNLDALARMLEPQMGPGVHARLQLALLEDMGYLPAGSSESSGADREPDFVWTDPETGTQVAVEMKTTKELPQRRLVEVFRNAAVEFSVRLVEAAVGSHARDALSELDDRPLDWQLADVRNRLIARYLEQAGGDPADAMQLLVHDGPEGANATPTIFDDALKVLAAGVRTRSRDQLIAAERARLEGDDQADREQEHADAFDLVAHEEEHTIESEQEEPEHP